jgi:predicted secreted protein
MAFVHGKSAYFKINSTDLSSYCSDVGLPRSIETAETTAFGKAAKTYIVGLTDGTISASGKWDSTADGVIAPLVGASSLVTYEVGPEGSSSGKVKYSGSAIITSYEVSAPVGDAVTFTLQLQCSDTITRGTYA